jgi:hypothetical protein
MLEIEEVELRILCELQEAGEENVPTLLNTTMPRSGDPSELLQVQRALENLMRADLVRTAIRSNPPSKLQAMSKNDSLAALVDLQLSVGFRQSDQHWTGIRDPWLEIVATDAGLGRADEILQQYGYQWWRQQP